MHQMPIFLFLFAFNKNTNKWTVLKKRHASVP